MKYVIGFIRKNAEKQNIEKIDINKAQELSLKYLKKIYNDEVMLKSIEENNDHNYLPYYSLIYCREKNGYASYFDEIKLNINKENGLLTIAYNNPEGYNQENETQKDEFEILYTYLQ